MITEKKSANAIGGKTVRACDSCIRRRARWYCAADDAFLCQACDSSVHSANQLASRHERVRLGISSLKDTVSEGCLDANSMPSWHQGFTRKARTPRHAKPMTLGQLHPSTKDDDHEEKLSNTFPLVPEIGSEEASLLDDNEEQLLYRVPVFDPFDSELCKVSNDTEKTVGDESKGLSSTDYGRDGSGEVDNLHGFLLPSDMDLAQFAADVESLLGRGLDEDYSDIKGLGLFDSKEEDGIDVCFGNKRVKIENEEEEIMEGVLECELEMRHETLDWNFDYESQAVTGEGEEEEEEKVVVGMAETARIMSGRCEGEYSRWKMSLKLNHEAVIAAWASQGSPWTTGIRPEFNPDDYWHDFMGLSPTDVHHPYVEVGGGGGGHVGGCDKGREARVSRYREKRRTRLFSKKIRYEVRKLNAEKRPRMKGRFVKRTSFAGPAFTYLNK